MAPEQLGLFLSERLSYSPSNFILHRGVSELIESLTVLWRSKSFSVAWIEGGNRTGKTHLSIKLTDLVSRDSVFPFLVEGNDLIGWIKGRNRSLQSDEVLIVDNAENAFLPQGEDNRGAFVKFVEESRSLGGSMIFLSRAKIKSLSCDDHIKSRLRPGEGFLIGDPAEEDILHLLKCIASQRGIRLKERKLAFLDKRIARDIPSIERYFDRLTHLSRVLGAKIRFPLLGDAVERG